MAILPEELPVVLTIFLGLGAWRLAREKVLTRSMPAVELLGRHHRAVRRQDRHADDEPHGRAAAVDRRRPSYDTGRRRCAGTAGGVARRCWNTPCWPATAAPSIRWSRPSARPGSASWPAPSICTATGHWSTTTRCRREMLAMSRVWQSPDRQERLIAAKGAPEAIVDLCHLDAAQREPIARAGRGDGRRRPARAGGGACRLRRRRACPDDAARLRLRVPWPGGAGGSGAARRACRPSPSAGPPASGS